MDNKDFAKDEYFVRCCESVGIKSTARQAGKFRRRTGIAYIKGRGLVPFICQRIEEK